MPISGHTKLYGVTGNPVSHSLSPSIHNYLFKRFNIDSIYVAFPVDVAEFPSLAKAFLSTSVEGINITSPHKTGLIGSNCDVESGSSGKVPLTETSTVLGQLSNTAAATGSVNTLVKRRFSSESGSLNAKAKSGTPFSEKVLWEGHNTDGRGVCDYIEVECGICLRGSSVIVFGAGPAARTAVFEAVRRNASVVVLNRSEERFENSFWSQIKTRGNVHFSPVIDDTVCRSFSKKDQIVINSTSWGQGGKDETTPFAFDVSCFHPSLVVDMNYSQSGVTPFTGLFPSCERTFDGKGMLRRQACHSFSLWTGIEIDEDTQKALANHVGSY